MLNKKIFYGWWVVFSASGISMMFAALHIQAFGAYAVFLRDDYGWSLALLSGAFALTRVESGLLGPIQGWMVDKYGPKMLLRVGMILFAFAGIFAPLFSQYFHENNSEKMTEIYQLSTKWIFVGCLPLFIFLMLFSNPMLMLFGNEFDNGLALKILSVGIMIQAFFGLGSSSLTMSGFSNINLLNVLAALTINIIMNIILIPQYGIIGAASATTIALFIISCLRFLENYYILSLNVFSLKLFKPLLSGILTVGVILFSQRYILNLLDYSSSLLNLSLYLLMAVAFVFIGYFSFYTLLGIDREDRDMIDSLKKRISNQA